MNFDTLIRVVDTIGGIEVESEYDFSIEGHHFVKGTNRLDGVRALAFARERKSFAGGDRVRGEHQQMVIEAIFRKILQPDMIGRASEIVGQLADSLQTNMPPDAIKTLIREQIGSMAGWSVENTAVDGSGDSQTTYSGGRQLLYVMQPDWGTVEVARGKIAEYLAK